LRDFDPVISSASPSKRLLSFQNLVELHVLSSIRKVHKVDLPSVRRAIDYIQKRFNSDHPLLDKQMLTDGKSLFIEEYGNVVNVSEQGQLEMKKLLELYLKRIDRDKHGLPVRLYPVTRKDVLESPRFIAIDPSIRFGRPCIAGTRIPSRIIAERHEAGDSVATLAKDYGRKTEEIEEALRYESRAVA
jgi:uncharacterized protein (DUF433 family)